MPSRPIDFSKDPNHFAMRNKNVLITVAPAKSGTELWFAIAKYLVLVHSAWVTIAGHPGLNGNVIVNEIRPQGAKHMNHIQFVTTNVLSYASQLNAFKTAIAFHPCGTLDLVIPGAGPVCPSLDLFDATTVNGDPAEPNSWTLDVELKSIYYTVHLALHYFKVTVSSSARMMASTGMTNNHKPHIILLGSLASYGTVPNPTYAAGKWGLRGMFRALRPITEQRGVRMNMLTPTRMIVGPGMLSPDQAADPTMRGIFFAKEEDVLKGVERLVGDESVDGRSLVIAPTAAGQKVGSSNFDIRDDVEGLDGVRELMFKLKRGIFGQNGVAQLTLSHYQVHMAAGNLGKTMLMPTQPAFQE